MLPSNIIRAWKDEAYRASLSEAELTQVPDHPSGVLELNDAELNNAAGGIITFNLVCESLRHCTFGDDCPSLIYTICGTVALVCCPV